MEILNTIASAREFVAKARRAGKSIGLVPTMGYFHQGHLTLMDAAKAQNDIVVVSIFVNPTQFGPNEDFRTYPRDFDRDAGMADAIGVDAIFSPPAEEMYPEGYSTYVNVEGLTEGMCGASRPGHFRGVTTVVLKLFNIVPAHRAYFGMKDYQQLKVIERMVKDLNVPIEIVPVPTVRERDGLAMSSRNTHLSTEERTAALILRKALDYGQKLMSEGLSNSDDLRKKVEDFIRTEPLAQIDYVTVVDPETLQCVQSVSGDVLLALAIRMGKTRLIDNAILRLPVL